MAENSKWPAGWSIYHGDPKATSPDGSLDFIVPTGDGYEKGDRCKVVNLRTGAVLHQVDHGEYWNDGDGGLSHGGINAAWKPDPSHPRGWLCAAEFTGKWQPRNLTVLEIGPGDRFVETDLWTEIEKRVAAHFKGKVPDRTYNDNFAVLITETTTAWESDGSLVIKATADSNPKDDESRDKYSCPLTLRWNLTKKQLSLEAGKLDFRKAAFTEK